MLSVAREWDEVDSGQDTGVRVHLESLRPVHLTWQAPLEAGGAEPPRRPPLLGR
jgi:hypothetical protein